MLLKLGLTANGASTGLAQLGAEIGISAAEFHGAMKRTAAAGLLDRDPRRPRVSPFLEFLEHGLRYVFVSQRGAITRGIPTAHSAPPLRDLLMEGVTQPGRLQEMYENLHGRVESPTRLQDMFAKQYANVSETLVWPHPDGDVRGESFEPLYPTAVDAARRDERLYECLALVDALRTGRARERRLAIDLLATKLRES